MTCRLEYDTITGKYSNASGVEIRVIGFGVTQTVEYLSTGAELPITAYMNDLVNYFVNKGYVRGETIRAAPYDWRLSASMYIFVMNQCCLCTF